MSLTVRDPLDATRADFEANLWRTIEPLGGRVTEQFASGQRRVQFGDSGAFLDIQAGPGGNPMVRLPGGYAYIADRGEYEMGQRGPTGRFREESSWDVLGAVLREAGENARGSADPVSKFANTVSYRLGMNQLEEGEGLGTRFLPLDYERQLPGSALRDIASTRYLKAAPAQALPDVYPGMIARGTERAGMIPMISAEDRAISAIGGVAQAGGKSKASGVQPYGATTLTGFQWREMTTGQGLPMRAQRAEGLVPLAGSFSSAEGQAMVRQGQRTEKRMPVVKPLTGWGTEELSNVARIRQGAIATGGSALDVLMGREGQSLYQFQDRHWSEAQLAGGYISLDKSFADTPWFRGLSQEQRAMYRIGDEEGGGGVVVGGRVEPALVMDAILRRGAAGSTSGKGMGQKSFLREGNFENLIVGGMSPEEIGRLQIVYEDAPKDPYTFMVSAGSALGILRPGESLFQGDKLNMPLAKRLTAAIAQQTRDVTFRREVTPDAAGAYISGAVKGVSGGQWLESGNYGFNYTTQAYAGPLMHWTREEYPAAHSRVSPEQMAHLRGARPALAARVEQVGTRPDSHVGIAQALWASYGQRDASKGALRYEDIQDKITAIQVATGGERGALARGMVQAGIGNQQIIMPGERGMVMPSAQHILGLSATDPAGEEVSRMVNTWERGVLANDPAYLDVAAETVSGKGFVKRLQTREMPGVAGPAAAYETIPVGELRIGTSQWSRFARSVYGRDVSAAEKAELLATINEQQVLGLTTRYPHSDVYNQNQAFQRLVVGGVGEEEIGINPAVPAMMRGDNDTDQYFWWTTAFQRAKGGLLRDAEGRIVVNNEGMGSQLTGLQAKQSILQMLEQTDPDAVARAREEVAQIQSLQEAPDETRIGEIVRRSQIFSNEIAKAIGKQQAGVRGESQDDIAQTLLSQLMNIKGPQELAQKGATAALSKEFMARAYPLRRNVAEFARDLHGSDSPITQLAFSAAAGGYQVAIDQGMYTASSPLGYRGTGDPKHPSGDPELSFGMARWMERSGTQSFLYGGGFLANVTTPYTRRPVSKWTDAGTRESEPGYGPQWIKGGHSNIESALSMLRVGIGQTAMYGAEFTPEQVGALLTTGDEQQMGAVAKAVREAREWASGQKGTANQQLITPEGMAHREAIMEAAGLSSNEAVWASEAPMVAADRTQMLLRTANQIRRAEQNKRTAPEFYEGIQGQMQELNQSFKAFTGQDLNYWMDEARQVHGKQELVGGNIYARERTAQGKAQELARLVPDIAGENLREPSRSTTRMNLRASSLPASEGQLFANLLQRERKIEGGWGSTGEKMHKSFEKALRAEVGDERIRSEEQLLFRGTLKSLFGSEEDVAFSGKPDVALQAQEGGGYRLLDFKTYRSTEGYDPRQLQVYAAALGEQGIDVTEAAYVHLPRMPKGADPDEYAQGLVKKFQSGDLYTEAVPLAETQQERRAIARKHTEDLSARRAKLEGLTDYITDEEALALSGMGFKRSIEYGEELLAEARTRQGLGLPASDINQARAPRGGQAVQSPVQRIGQEYGVNLEALGARGARVLGQDAYAAAVAEIGGDPASGGFTVGGNITVRSPTAEEQQRSGASSEMLVQRRLMHEGGHTLYESSPEIREQALSQVDAAIAAGSLDRGKLEALYGENWREMGAREYVAQGVAGSAGQLPTYGSQVSKFDVSLSRIGSQALSGVGGAGDQPPGDGGGDVSFLASPRRQPQGGGGQGGGLNLANMGVQDFGTLLGSMLKAQWGDRDRTVLKSPIAQRLGFEVAMGNMQALTGEAAERLTEAGEFDQLGALQKFQGYMRGKGGQLTGTNLSIATELSSLAQSSDELLAGMTGPQFQTGINAQFAGTATARLRRQAMETNPIEGLKEFTDGLVSATGRLKDHEEAIVKATEGYENLTKEQKEGLKTALGDLKTVLKGQEQLGTMGWQGHQEGQRITAAALNQRGESAISNIQAAQLAMEQAQINASYGQLQRGFGDRVLQGAGDLYHDLTSGWKMMQVNRVWGMTGGRAIDAQNVAMQQEMAVQGAMASWTGGGNLGPVSQGLLGIQARNQVAQAGMGRGAYMAYGGVQNMLAGATGEAAGVGLPALGAGMAAASLFGGPVGIAVGGAAALYGGLSYAHTLANDQDEMAYRAGGNFWDTMMASAGMMWNATTGKGWGDGAALRERGLAMRSGEIGAFKNDPGAQAIVMRDWAEKQANKLGVMGSDQWAVTAGKFQAYSGKEISNLNEIPADLLAQAAVRGYDIEGMGGLSQQLGGTSDQFLPLLKALLAAPNSAGTMTALQQYGVAGQLGYVGPEYFTQNLGSLQEMTSAENRRFQAAMQGDRQTLSRYAAGQDIGLTGTGMDLFSRAFGTDTSWMMTLEPDTGMPIHTTTGQYYGGKLETEAARQGGQWGIQTKQFELQVEDFQARQAHQWNRFQTGYAYQTGEMLPGYQGSVSSSLMNLIGQTGGMWGLQDQARDLSWGYQQQQFGFQKEGFDLSNRQWMENWQSRWNKLQTSQQWAGEDFSNQRAKYAVQDEHWLYQWGMQENKAQLQFGWGMQDLDENIRFATGRDKLRLMRQKERSTISESMRSESSEESKDYWEKMTEFRDKELVKAEERHDQQMEWAEADLERDRKHHEERTQQQQREMEAARRYAEEQHALENRRIQLERAYWRDMQRAQAEEMQRQRVINELQLKLRADQMALNYDQQMMMARFQTAISSASQGVSTLTSRVQAFNTAARNVQTPSTGIGGKTYHSGGPVGLMGGQPSASYGGTGLPGEVAATLQSGEYVVPKDGQLVVRDDRTVELLGQIRDALIEGNGRFTIMVANPERSVQDVTGALDAAYRS